MPGEDGMLTGIADTAALAEDHSTVTAITATTDRVFQVTTWKVPRADPASLLSSAAESRHSVNGSDCPIGRLRYLTAAMGRGHVSSVPTCEIESISAQWR